MLVTCLLTKLPEWLVEDGKSHQLLHILLQDAVRCCTKEPALNEVFDAEDAAEREKLGHHLLSIYVWYMGRGRIERLQPVPDRTRIRSDQLVSNDRGIGR